MSTKKVPKEFRCLECGLEMTASQAHRALAKGCSGCGGVDIDLNVALDNLTPRGVEVREAQHAAAEAIPAIEESPTAAELDDAYDKMGGGWVGTETIVTNTPVPPTETPETITAEILAEIPPETTVSPTEEPATDETSEELDILRETMTKLAVVNPTGKAAQAIDRLIKGMSRTKKVRENNNSGGGFCKLIRQLAAEGCTNSQIKERLVALGITANPSTVAIQGKKGRDEAAAALAAQIESDLRADGELPTE